MGIDVAQPHLDVAFAGEDTVWRVSHDATGLTELCARRLDPTPRVPEGHNLRPQVTTAQPLVTEPRHRGRHSWGHGNGVAPHMFLPGLGGCGQLRS